jgi:hypothetical protein
MMHGYQFVCMERDGGSLQCHKVDVRIAAVCSIYNLEALNVE